MIWYENTTWKMMKYHLWNNLCQKKWREYSVQNGLHTRFKLTRFEENHS